MRKHVAVLALVAVAIALTGCGGSSKSSGQPGDTTPGNTTKSGDNNGSGGNDNLSKLLAKAKAATYKVTYQSDNESFTIAQDPPKFSFVQGDSATYINEDGSAVSCSGTGSTASCTKLPGTGEALKTGLTAGLGAFAALFVSQAANIPGLVDIKTTDETIAGRDAACATIDAGNLGALSAAIKGSYTVCVDKETGIMLQTKSDSGSGSTNDITATDFTNPTDADFTPPATPSTIPGQ